MHISKLRPFLGLHSSLIAFSTGHVFRISHWTKTPTEFGPFSNLWMVTPEGRRLLFSDPPPSERIVRIYHKFDEVHPSTISLERPHPNQLRLLMTAHGAARVDIQLQIERTLRTRFLVALSRAMPIAWTATDPGVRLVGLLASALIARGKVNVGGRTETDQPFFAGDVDDLLLVKRGAAWLDGTALGQISPPDRPVAFGDLAATPQSYVVLGRLYLAYQSAQTPNGGA